MTKSNLALKAGFLMTCFLKIKHLTQSQPDSIAIFIVIFFI